MFKVHLLHFKKEFLKIVHASLLPNVETHMVIAFYLFFLVSGEDNVLESKDGILNTGNSKKNSKDSQKSIFNICKYNEPDGQIVI